MSWYPLGRPIGTTIYPGMQVTSVAIWRLLKATGLASLQMSLNDVCCFVPCWFGVSATLLLGLLTSEAANSGTAGIFAAAVMAIVPAHLMRSVGGGFDNESIAVTAMCLTFWLWVRSLRNERSWPVGILTGLAYVNMVAAWGGYVFVLNLIGVHAGVLTLLGLYSTSLHRAYSLFYAIGTYGAMSVPVVGWAPLKSLEQLGPFGVFAFMQLLELSNAIVRAKKLSPRDAFKLRGYVFALAASVASVVLAVLLPTGYFGPLSSRVRGLFVKHTRTGNPLVDSVAEHQPASDQAYYQYLQVWTCYLAPAGFAYVLCYAAFHYSRQHLANKRIPAEARLPAKAFLLVYGVVGYYFCNKMVRLIILLGPVASALSGVAAGLGFDWAVAQFSFLPQLGEAETDGDEDAPRAKGPAKGAAKGAKASGKKEGAERDGARRGAKKGGLGGVGALLSAWGDKPAVRTLRLVAAVCVLFAQAKYYRDFYHTCQAMAEGMSQPSIMFRAHLRDGTPVMIDDYREVRDQAPRAARLRTCAQRGAPQCRPLGRAREGPRAPPVGSGRAALLAQALKSSTQPPRCPRISRLRARAVQAYWWLRDNTPADARVMAWWDYGMAWQRRFTRSSLSHRSSHPLPSTPLTRNPPLNRRPRRPSVPQATRSPESATAPRSRTATRGTTSTLPRSAAA